MKYEFILLRNTTQKNTNMVINSNDRFSRYPKAKMTKRIREKAKYLSYNHGQEPFSPVRPCKVTVWIYSPTKRRLDPPNLYPTVKALIDGLTESKVWTDDNHEVIREMSFKYGGLSGVKGHYKIVLEIGETK